MGVFLPTAPIWGEASVILLSKAVAKLADDQGMSQFAPHINDSLNILLWKLASIIDGGSFSGGGGGGGGGSAAAVNGLAGLKAVTTVGLALRTISVVDLGAGVGMATYILRSGTSNSDPDLVRPTDYSAGTPRFWELTST